VAKKTGIERRRHRRIDVEIPGELHIKDSDVRYDVLISNISEGGAFIKTENIPLTIGQEVSLRIVFAQGELFNARIVLHHKTMKSLPDDVAELAHVRWLRMALSSGFGIQFTNLRDDKIKFIRKLFLEEEMKKSVDSKSSDTKSE